MLNNAFLLIYDSNYCIIKLNLKETCRKLLSFKTSKPIINFYCSDMRRKPSKYKTSMIYTPNLEIWSCMRSNTTSTKNSRNSFPSGTILTCIKRAKDNYSFKQNFTNFYSLISKSKLKASEIPKEPLNDSISLNIVIYTIFHIVQNRLCCWVW